MTAKKTGPPCPYCNSPTEFIDSKIVYGRWYGWLLACTRYPQCDAYVGCHGESKNPLGRLANRQLREAKKQAHAAFDPMWRRDGMRRKDAYAWLAERLGLELKHTHIGEFDVEQCRKVVEVCTPASESTGA